MPDSQLVPIVSRPGRGLEMQAAAATTAPLGSHDLVLPSDVLMSERTGIHVPRADRLPRQCPKTT